MVKQLGSDPWILATHITTHQHCPPSIATHLDISGLLEGDQRVSTGSARMRERERERERET